MRENCQFCNGEFRLNVVACRRTRTKYLRAGCCDGALRPCPEPAELLRSAKLTQDERDYLQRIAKLDWFSGRVATVLLRIEAKVKASMGVANA
ncbi:hypothetical protein NIES4072_03940 [Nostoc commune NIES-4072]|uniref:Uncharacterized protein n=1 Tax=Nostoc commune NIES-4072 TaxID=2005467 RepID=A0A2R5FHE0_NOSCO|nr:hypothetical protein [Nostoc commune]BBD65927.1 hypothetical protein NIES4070_22880 [Nostoc commune HK-02]GBG16748.1 hypothetical protein NIES4072_03940 [Nostoc commune NIES-4072]